MRGFTYLQNESFNDVLDDDLEDGVEVQEPFFGDANDEQPGTVAAAARQALPITKATAKRVTLWLKSNFGQQLHDATSAPQNQPFSPALLSAMICQESAYFFAQFMTTMSANDIVARCVLDASGEIPDAPRTAFPRNTEAFRRRYGQEFTDKLIDEANLTRALRGFSPRRWVYKGYGIFQYDLQFVESDEAYFRDKKWHDFRVCLDRTLSELRTKYQSCDQDLWCAVRRYNGGGARALQYMKNVREFYTDVCKPTLEDTRNARISMSSTPRAAADQSDTAEAPTALARAVQAETYDALTSFYSSPDRGEESELDLVRRSADAGFLARASGGRLTWSDVSWVGVHSNNADYWHLPGHLENQSFSVDAALIQKLIASGHYDPFVTQDGMLIVAVRGAKLSGGDVLLDQEVVQLSEQKPDHQNFRCVIIAFNKSTGKISAFKASTVPNRGGVASQYNQYNGFGGDAANMLPTGAYELCVGTHYGSATVPNVLRLGTGPEPVDSLRVTTLRTINDGVYGTADMWDNCKPSDNLHPAFSAQSAQFSSLGCLTVPGSYDGSHSGNWAKFQRAAKFSDRSDLGNRYNLLLTTGLELACLARTLAGSDATLEKSLMRLSHGSVGDAVRRLQHALGVSADGKFEAATKMALTKLEATRMNGVATGIYSGKSEEMLQLNVFGAAPNA